MRLPSYEERASIGSLSAVSGQKATFASLKSENATEPCGRRVISTRWTMPLLGENSSLPTALCSGRLVTDFSKGKIGEPRNWQPVPAHV